MERHGTKQPVMLLTTIVAAWLPNLRNSDTVTKLGGNESVMRQSISGRLVVFRDLKKRKVIDPVSPSSKIRKRKRPNKGHINALLISLELSTLSTSIDSALSQKQSLPSNDSASTSPDAATALRSERGEGEEERISTPRNMYFMHRTYGASAEGELSRNIDSLAPRTAQGRQGRLTLIRRVPDVYQLQRYKYNVKSSLLQHSLPVKESSSKPPVSDISPNPLLYMRSNLALVFVAFVSAAYASPVTVINLSSYKDGRSFLISFVRAPQIEDPLVLVARGDRTKIRPDGPTAVRTVPITVNMLHQADQAIRDRVKQTVTHWRQHTNPGQNFIVVVNNGQGIDDDARFRISGVEPCLPRDCEGLYNEPHTVITKAGEPAWIVRANGQVHDV
ncbi:hypothetical protein D9757_009750 [Collybiopsis confluens]|uniref:Uncharacterized protein n=1 Tax=Collybiopsis confluens TaxID=2823264 RepID=A0A8H5LXW0_9AGAR|nr:hypothetical protein D9757_009750 [Collybiopsis confluens]